MCRQSYVTLCRYIQSIKLFGTNSRFLFSQYNLNSIQKHGSSSVNTVCAVGLGWLYSILQPSFITTVHKSCCCVRTLLYFSQQVWEFFVVGHVFKLTLGECNLWEVCVSDVLVQWAGGQKVQLCFHCILCAVGAQSVFPWERGLSVAAFLYSYVQYVQLSIL